MMPLPGCQKPMPYFAPEVARKSYTSLFVTCACLRSATPPNLPSLHIAITSQLALCQQPPLGGNSL